MIYRKQVKRAIKAAGVKPWPKLFQNCRASRETELAEQYPVQVVCAWIGNSPEVAAKHYLQVTDEHFARATAQRSDVETESAAESYAAPDATDVQDCATAESAQEETGECTAADNSPQLCTAGSGNLVRRQGLEPRTR